MSLKSLLMVAVSFVFSGAFIMPTFATDPVGYARFSINAGKDKINLTPGTALPGGTVQNPGWAGEAERKQMLIVEIPLNDGWNEFSFTFMPDKAGNVQMDLTGRDKTGAGTKRIVLYTFYDDISVTGAELKNGDFELLQDGKPVGWYIWSQNPATPGMIVGDTNAHGGKNYAAAWSQGTVVQYIKVAAGQVTVRGFAKPTGDWKPEIVKKAEKDVAPTADKNVQKVTGNVTYVELFNEPFRNDDALDKYSVWQADARVLPEADGSGNALCVSVPERIGNASVTISFDAPLLAGKKVEISAEVRGENIAPAKESYNGGKFMLTAATASGKQLWPGGEVKRGTFGWEKISFETILPADLKSAQLTLGFQDSFGKIFFRNIKVVDKNAVKTDKDVVPVVDTNRAKAAENNAAKVVAKDIPIDLSKALNMNFADDIAGDGKGGWSDQGPGNDFREFDVKASVFGGIPFKIIDPVKNNNKGVLTLKHDQSFPSGPAAVTLDLPESTSGRYLYLLHTSCYGMESGGVVGSVKFTGRDGSDKVVVIKAKQDVADWWNAGRLPNGVVVVAKPNQSAQVGIYLSRFDLGSTVDARSMVITTSGKVLWIVIGATLSNRDVPLPEMKKMAIVSGADWKQPPDASLAIKAGTALDFSAWVDHAPAGSRGQLNARPDGTLAFASQPDKPVRFFCASGFPLKNPDEIDAWADTIVRQGYNLVRLHFMDQFLSGQGAYWGKKLSLEAQKNFDRRLESGEQLFNPESLDLMDRFIAALKKRGVYLTLDGLSSWTGLYPANCWYADNGVENMKSRLYYDPVARRHWHNSIKAIFTRINPYTGTSLATDPQVVLIVGVNETTMGLENKKTTEKFLPLWRAFLAKRFVDAAAYRKSWNQQDSTIDSFDKAPFFSQNDVWHSARVRTIAEFLNQLEEESAGWMEKELRSFGYKGLFTEYDWLYSLRLYLPRSLAGMVIMHGYFSHPEGAFNRGGKTSQNSSLLDALNWWRGMASCRIAGESLGILEYGHVYWNSYRYEEGLSVGAYSSFQDMSMMTAHAWPVALKPGRLGPFNVGSDPIGRASQVVTGLTFMGRTVAVAPHRVDIPLSRDLALNNSERAISGDQNRIGLLTGFAVAVEGRTPSIPAAMQLPLGDGTKTIDSAFWSSVVDSESGTFAGAVTKLRNKGILPEGNRTDAKKKIYESETGEILLDTTNKRLTVHTPMLTGVCAEKIDGAMQIGKMTVVATSVPASITLASRDGKVLELSNRLLLVIATDARNSGDIYDDDRGSIIRKVGTLPVLVRTGRFTVDIARDPKAPALRAWALAMDGSRRDELQVKSSDNGIQLKIDTATWSCGPSPFIELAVK